ncbi:hypothetical protein ACHQM5_013790 [Ranunculus cassubicifolius]
MKEEEQPQDMNEEILQQLRSKATELLLREEWQESIQIYSHFISLCQQHLSNTQENLTPDQFTKLQKSLCLAFSNRAEARSRLRDFEEAIVDCDQALKIENTHSKTLICKEEMKEIMKGPTNNNHNSFFIVLSTSQSRPLILSAIGG